jgi:hypothetical protein
MQLLIPLQPFRRLLLAIWAVFAVTGFTVEILHYTFFLESRPLWVDVLSLSYEDNLPTWYSSLLLSSCGLMLACIWCRPPAERHGHGFFWGTLCLGFFYMSLDESASYHEQMSLWFHGNRGILYFGWVMPAGGLVLVLLLVFLKFLFTLPGIWRRRFVLAGVTYVGGALLMELPLGWWMDKHGSDGSFGYVLIDAVQESMEILGSTLFLRALLQYFNERPRPTSASS